MNTEFVPAEVFSPGEYLRDELEARGWTQTEFAEILGRPVAAVNEIINGKRSITPATAKELAAALGTSAIFWLNLDAAYQLNRSEPAPRRIAIEARLRERYPVREMIQRGWIENSENHEVLENRVLNFFGVESLDQEPALPMAARRSGSLEDELSPLQIAWLFRVKQIAEAMEVAPYSELKLRQLLLEMRKLLSSAEAIAEVPRLLAECGVRFLVVEPLPSSKFDGVCFWLDESSPVVGMTLRYDRIDNFWFVLRHELEHVLRRDAAIDEIDPSQPNLSEQETAANVAASEFCVPGDVLDDFILRVRPIFSEKRVVGLAKTLDVHPGIVVGQLHNKLSRYDLFRKHLVGVRDVLTQHAWTDGYGRPCPV